MIDRPRRRASDPREAAEMAFKKATAAPPLVSAPKPTAIPAAKESVTLRIDRDVLEAYQENGPGWQERINAALRKAAGLDTR